MLFIKFPTLPPVQVIGGQVCFKATRRSVVLDVYSARARLHEEVYTHPVCKAVELMIVDALALAAEELGIAG
jgi:HD superfamily phosphohydrolase